MSETNVYRIWIKATPERIWRALTDPQELEGYGYGGRFEVDIRAGGEYRVGATDQMLQAGAPELTHALRPLDLSTPIMPTFSAGLVGVVLEPIRSDVRSGVPVVTLLHPAEFWLASYDYR